jgi:hypothetical protein
MKKLSSSVVCREDRGRACPWTRFQRRSRCSRRFHPAPGPLASSAPVLPASIQNTQQGEQPRDIRSRHYSSSLDPGSSPLCASLVGEEIKSPGASPLEGVAQGLPYARPPGPRQNRLAGLRQSTPDRLPAVNLAALDASLRFAPSGDCLAVGRRRLSPGSEPGNHRKPTEKKLCTSSFQTAP